MTYQPHRYPEPPIWPPEATPAWANARSRAYLTARHVTKEESYQYDLAYAAGGSWKDRLLIPQYDAHDHLLMFQGRSLDDSEPRYRTAGTRHLYNPEQIISGSSSADAGRVVIVEGFFDLLAVARVTPNVVATFGTMVSPLQIQEILALAFPHVVILFDRGAERESYELQLKLQPHVETTIIFLADDKDPGDMAPDKVSALLT